MVAMDPGSPPSAGVPWCPLRRRTPPAGLRGGPARAQACAVARRPRSATVQLAGQSAHACCHRRARGVSHEGCCRGCRSARGILGCPVSEPPPRPLAGQRSGGLGGGVDNGPCRGAGLRRPSRLARPLPDLHWVTGCGLHRPGAAGGRRDPGGANSWRSLPQTITKPMSARTRSCSMRSSTRCG